MDNGLLIALAIIFTIILIGINIYILALYSHTDDKGFGTALYCKLLVVIGLTVCQAQALMVPLDVANLSAIDQSGIGMKGFWYFIYLFVLILICLLMPFALFFYETDEEDGFCKRFVRSFLYTLAANIVSVLLLFISWAFFKFVDLPVHSISSDKVGSLSADFNNWTINQTDNDTTLEIQASFAVYVIAIMSFFGWICVVVCGGVGIFSLPLDMISSFRNRPKAKRSSQMMQQKKKLAKAIANLKKQAQELKKQDEEFAANHEAGWFDKWRGRRAADNKFTEYKAKFYTFEEEIDTFKIELQFNKSNPIIPVLKLVLAVIFFITSFLWILQIIFGNIAKSFTNRPLIPFLNEFLISLDDGNAGFIATGIYAYFCLYMIWCVQKGTLRFGARVPCLCRFHPMKQNETWMNSFLFNVIIMLIASVGVIQLCISSFPTYTRNTQIYIIIGLQLNYMRFYSAFYKNNVFLIALVVWTFLSLVYLCCTCNKKPDYSKRSQQLRGSQKEDD